MQLAFGTVVDGKIVVVGDPLPEGALVTVLIREKDEVFEVPPEMEAELQQALGEADRGEVFSMNARDFSISDQLQQSAGAAAYTPEPTPAERAEWQRRLAEHHRDPASSIPWETLRAELFKRTR